MVEHFAAMVPGAAAPVGQHEVLAPFDGQLLGTVDLAGADTARTALATAHALFRDRSRWLPAPRRIEILTRTAALMEERLEALAVGAAREGGKPLADSLVEVARAIDGVRSCARGAAHRGGPRRSR